MAVSPYIYSGTFIHTLTPSALTVLEDVSVYVDSNGIIAEISPSAAPIRCGWESAQLVFSGENQFFFPGFIDTHIHASQFPNAGIFGNSTLLEWLRKYTFPLEISLSSLKEAHSIYSRVIARTLSHGTTTASYFATIHLDSTKLLADLCLAAGQRAFIGGVCMDQNSPENYRDDSAAYSIAKTEAILAHCRKIDPNGDLVQTIITPRFAPTCSAPLLKSLGDLARRESVPVQTHISENKDEISWVAELFPNCANYADVYEHAGLLTERTVLAHGVHLNKDEIATIKRNGSGVSHCPLSNMSLTSGNAFVKRLMQEGVKVGLGTDISGGYSVSLLQNVRQATLVSRMVAMSSGISSDKISISEALYLGTRGGAEILGIQDKVGAFKVGMEWDAILVDLGHFEKAVINETSMYDENGLKQETVHQLFSALLQNPVDIFGWEVWEEKVAKWVYGGDDRNNKHVWVKGKSVYKRYY